MVGFNKDGFPVQWWIIEELVQKFHPYIGLTVLPLPGDSPVESSTPVTDSEKRSAEVVSDVLTGKILKPDLPRIREAIDKVEAPKSGRDKADHAIGHSISGNRR